ncbi:unnamed protein product [Caenorhabditis angaria]|uniref:Pseudouridine synthase II N-terminal domain-containing protein n=1 Tax=Caenorhabditis angaria TaxID=860376 RepID=A0A9P1N4D5_9PELO|nr:unnamed protein product [Caenorhabditis angaria]
MSVWKAVSGVLCVYKPSGISSSAIKKLITNRITEFNSSVESTSRLQLPIISLPIVEPHESSGALLVVGSKDLADYRHHPLVCGSSIRPEDIHIVDPLPLHTNSSGVCLFGINEGSDSLPEIMSKSWTNVYRFDGIFTKVSPKDEKLDLSKITRHKFEKVISRLESQFRSAAFEHANVDKQSEEAFDLARKGLPRAQLPGAQVIYSIEINWLKVPRFSITIQCSGEDDEMLKNFASTIGSSLGCSAVPIRIQRKCFGPFSSVNALLEKQFNLQNFIRNVNLNKKIIENSKIDQKLVGQLEESENLENREIFDGLGLNESTKIDDYDAMRPAWPRNYN